MGFANPVCETEVTHVRAVKQQSDYSVDVAEVDDFLKTRDSAMTLLLSHLTDFIGGATQDMDVDGEDQPSKTVLAEAARLGEQDLPVYKLLSENKLAEFIKGCADFIENALPVGAGLSQKAKFKTVINGYQGKYAIPKLAGLNDKRLIIKNAPIVGSEQLLRRIFDFDGKALYNPFGGFFLAKIQSLPYVVKFWLLLCNIIEVIPRNKAGEDVTINYFAQLFPIEAGSGKNLYDGLQEATSALWGCKFRAEAMDLEQKMRKTEEARLRAAMEAVALAQKVQLSFDDFGPSHLAWTSKVLKDMTLNEVKMAAEMKAKIVDQYLQEGESSLLTQWIQKVCEIKFFFRIVLEGSDNCAGVHPGVIFTDETRSDKSIPHAAQLEKYTQVQVEEAHAAVVERIQSAFPEKTVCIQGGFGVIEKEVDPALASLCAQLGQGNVAATLGSSAWLTFAKGYTRSTEMGLATPPGVIRVSLTPSPSPPRRVMKRAVETTTLSLKSKRKLQLPGFTFSCMNTPV
jgi:hypothetical protein